MSEGVFQEGSGLCAPVLLRALMNDHPLPSEKEELCHLEIHTATAPEALWTPLHRQMCESVPDTLAVLTRGGAGEGSLAEHLPPSPTYSCLCSCPWTTRVRHGQGQFYLIRGGFDPLVPLEGCWGPFVYGTFTCCTGGNEGQGTPAPKTGRLLLGRQLSSWHPAGTPLPNSGGSLPRPLQAPSKIGRVAETPTTWCPGR